MEKTARGAAAGSSPFPLAVSSADAGGHYQYQKSSRSRHRRQSWGHHRQDWVHLSVSWRQRGRNHGAMGSAGAARYAPV